MQPPMRWLRILSISILCGCSSAPRIPNAGRNVADLYEAHFGRAQALSDQAIHRNDADLVGYTRSVANEIDQLFPSLPNPTLVMYVFPHARGDLLVPGYASAFPLFTRDHRALPGETP